MDCNSFLWVAYLIQVIVWRTALNVKEWFGFMKLGVFFIVRHCKYEISIKKNNSTLIYVRSKCNGISVSNQSSLHDTMKQLASRWTEKQISSRHGSKIWTAYMADNEQNNWSARRKLRSRTNFWSASITGSIQSILASATTSISSLIRLCGINSWLLASFSIRSFMLAVKLEPDFLVIYAKLKSLSPKNTKLMRRRYVFISIRLIILFLILESKGSQIIEVWGQDEPINVLVINLDKHAEKTNFVEFAVTFALGKLLNYSFRSQSIDKQEIRWCQYCSRKFLSQWCLQRRSPLLDSSVQWSCLCLAMQCWRWFRWEGKLFRIIFEL